LNEEDLHTFQEVTKWVNKPSSGNPVEPWEYWRDFFVGYGIGFPSVGVWGIMQEGLDPFIPDLIKFFGNMTNTYNDAHNWVHTKWAALGSWVGGLGTKLTHLYTQLVVLIDTIIKFPITVWLWVTATWTQITGYIWDLLWSLWDWVKESWGEFLDYIWRLAWAIWDWIDEAWDYIALLVQDFISEICEALRIKWAEWYGPIRDWVLARWEAIGAWVLAKWEWLKGYILEYWGTIKAWVLAKSKEYWDWIKKNVPGYWLKVKDLLGGILKEIWEFIIKTVMAVQERYVPAVVDGISRALDWLKDQFTWVIGTAYDELMDLAKSFTPITPAKSVQLAGLMFGSAVGFGALAHGLALAVEAVPNLKNIGVHYMSSFAAHMGGFGLISSATMGVIAALALRVPFTYYVNDLLRPTIPDDKLLIEFRAKREIDFPEFKRYMAFHGHSDEWSAKIDSWLWKDPRLFEILYCADVTVPPREWLVRKFERAGYEEIDVDVLCRVVERRTTRSPRAYYTTSLRRNFRHGFIGEAELTEGIEALEMAPEAIDWIKRAGDLDNIYEINSDLVTAYRTAYRNDVITEAECKASLASLGLPSGRVEAIIYLEWVRKMPSAIRAERKEIADEWADIQSSYSKAYIQAFRAGWITQGELVTCLVAIGYKKKVAEGVAMLEAVKLAVKGKPEQIPTPIIPLPPPPPEYES